MELRFLAAPSEQMAFLDLPWDMPLAEWPTEYLVALPRGLSRHVVRFTRLRKRVYALKEVVESYAIREYRLLRDLERLDVPSVTPVAVVTGRHAPDGAPLDPVLITAHLQWSLPYRDLFRQTLRPETSERLIDALVALVVRLHLVGFLWGDISLSNVLFRRDAGAFAAYLVDAETGELHRRLSDGQRRQDLETARENIAGGLLDLEAGGLLDAEHDPLALADLVVERYEALWAELTDWESFDINDRWRIGQRVERLNDLGFDVAELDIVTDIGGRQLRIQPKVVDAGHHARRLLRLTGIDAEENQARRLLNDLDAYSAATDQQGEDEDIVAHEWVTASFEPVVRGVPRPLRGKLEPAEIYHEVLEHRWYLSERTGRQVTMPEATRSYVADVLPGKPDEMAVLGRAVDPRLRRAAAGPSEDDVDHLDEDTLLETQPFRVPWELLS